MSEKYYNIIKEELEKFISKYQNNPFDFLTEYDIQSYLYSKIFDHFEVENFKVEIETNGIREPIKRWKKDGDLKIQVNPVKTEYPAGYLFDVAVINPDTVKKPSAYWHQELNIAIEIKYHRCSFNRIPSEVKKFKLDLEKLKKYKDLESPKSFSALSILFIQNDNEDRENEFENDKFKDDFQKIDINTFQFNNKIEGIVVTGQHVFNIKNL